MADTTLAPPVSPPPSRIPPRGWLQRVGQTLARRLDRSGALAPAPVGRWPRAAFVVVLVLIAAFVAFFVTYLFALHDAYQTHAEDLGIMDQALWTTLHGAPLHQTICNSLSDTNCLGDVSRFAIHFEPIMLLLSLLYLVAPSPKTLQFVQVVVVASGALPAYWLAARRLVSPLAGVIVAAAYLFFPALDAAVTYDFHAVTLSAAFLLFAFYFLLTHNDRWLIVACVLAMATKEEVPVDVVMIGLYAALLQRRGRLGWGLVALALVWLGGALVAIHAASPIGHSPTAARYAHLGGSPGEVAWYLLIHPVRVVRDYVLDLLHGKYLRALLAPMGYLPLLSPLVLVIAMPALAINLLSSDPAMYSGLYQYNAEIVPVLVAAGIEGAAAVLALADWLAARGARRPRGPLAERLHLPADMRRMRSWARQAVLLAILVLLATSAGREQVQHGYLPVAKGFSWPQPTAHSQLADQFIALLPANASVSAQSDLVPHLSHRRFVYLYPYKAQTADYVLLDVTGNQYPQGIGAQSYADGVRRLLTTQTDHVVAAADGYLLLAHGPGASEPSATGGADPLGLPPAFYSFTQTTPDAIRHPLAMRFGTSLMLVGYDVSPTSVIYLNHPTLTVTFYWRVTAPLAAHTTATLVLTRANHTEYLYSGFPTTEWLPMQRWQPGPTMVTRSHLLELSVAELGSLHIGVRVEQSTSTQDHQPIAAEDSEEGEQNATSSSPGQEPVEEISDETVSH